MNKRSFLIPALVAAFVIGFNVKGLMTKSPPAGEKKPVVRGLGGVFFKCKDPAALKRWYNLNLGLDTDEYGTNFEWRISGSPSKKGFTQWSPFSDKTKYFAPSEKDFMINYRVDNIAALYKQLRQDSVTIVDTIQIFDYGKFLHIMDPEGNKIELWEPNDVEYEKLVKGRTL